MILMGLARILILFVAEQDWTASTNILIHIAISTTLRKTSGSQSRVVLNKYPFIWVERLLGLEV